MSGRATQRLPSPFFALTGDVARAHRLGAKGDNVVWVNCVGTFGVSSAAYHWCRLMAGLGRSSFFFFGKLGWMQLVYVDDLWISSSPSFSITQHWVCPLHGRSSQEGSSAVG